MLSRTHPAVVFVIYAPVVAFLLWKSIADVGISVSVTLGLALAGIAAWTLTEYWLHRTIMHWIPQARWGDRFHYWVHGIHHRWPNDPYRLVMPPTVSLTLFFVFLGLFQSLPADYCWAFHAGFTFGYLLYDLAHYAFHHFRTRFSWQKNLQRHHLLHHFNPKFEERNFSITVPLWDRVFGTARAKENPAD
jgi:sterol desaturase/sphingolipid hydroxylase (fatty acid hydroxylase superfamily)